MLQQDTSVPGRGNSTFAEFFVDAVQNNFKSEQEGRPIFEDREFVKIIIPGDNKTEMVYQVTDIYKQQYPKQYEAFKRSEDQRYVSGTPLKHWPPMTPALVRTMEASNIHTVEQLAEITDSQMQHVGMGASEWAKKAKAFLSKASDGAEVTRMVADLKVATDEVARLTKVVSDQADELKTLRAAAKKA